MSHESMTNRRIRVSHAFLCRCSSWLGSAGPKKCADSQEQSSSGPNLPDYSLYVRISNTRILPFSGVAGHSEQTPCEASRLVCPRRWPRSGRIRRPSRTSTASPSGSGWKGDRRRCPSRWRSASGSWCFLTTSPHFLPAGSGFCRYEFKDENEGGSLR